MSTSALAKRYAQAFCEIAHERGILEESVKSLQSLHEAFEPALDVIFSNPDVTQDERHQLVDDAFDAYDGERDETFSLVRRFCKLLVDKRRFRYFDDIVEACVDESDRLLNRKRARVQTPYELGDSRRSRLKQKLAERFDADILLEETINSDLIAGLQIQVEDYLMDYSVQNELEKLYGRFNR